MISAQLKEMKMSKPTKIETFDQFVEIFGTEYTPRVDADTFSRWTENSIRFDYFTTINIDLNPQDNFDPDQQSETKICPNQ
jgi:hypothetical protein